MLKSAPLPEKVRLLLSELKAANSHSVRVRLIGELEERGVKPSIIQTMGDLPDYQLRHYRRVNQRLVAEVKFLFQQNKISFSKVKVIAGLPPDKQEILAREAIAKNLSVNSLRSKITGTHSEKFIRDLERLADRYSDETGFDIRIVADAKNSKAGLWVIAYHDLDMFDTIAEKLVGRTDDF